MKYDISYVFGLTFNENFSFYKDTLFFTYWITLSADLKNSDFKAKEGFRKAKIQLLFPFYQITEFHCYKEYVLLKSSAMLFTLWQSQQNLTWVIWCTQFGIFLIHCMLTCLCHLHQDI